MTDMTVHPVADLFPMLADDELAELAADIKTRGLLQPIVRDTEGRILDGRNRLAACQRAGIEPAFTTYEGDDPAGLAWSVNVKRRSLTKSQTAVIAVDRSELTIGKKFPTRKIAEEAGVSHMMIVWAQSVCRYRDLHDDVLLRSRSLKDAYDDAQERDDAEERRQAKIERLRTAASDLLSLVDDERMTVDDAIAALDAREAKARQEQDEQTRRRQVEQQEYRDELDRERGRIRMVITGWSTIQNTILGEPDSDRTREIIQGLGDTDRQALKEITAAIGG